MAREKMRRRKRKMRMVHLQAKNTEETSPRRKKIRQRVLKRENRVARLSL